MGNRPLDGILAVLEVLMTLNSHAGRIRILFGLIELEEIRVIFSTSSDKSNELLRELVALFLRTNSKINELDKNDQAKLAWLFKARCLTPPEGISLSGDSTYRLAFQLFHRCPNLSINLFFLISFSSLTVHCSEWRAEKQVSQKSVQDIRHHTPSAFAINISRHQKEFPNSPTPMWVSSSGWSAIQRWR